jgi:hypothetical protein
MRDVEGRIERYLRAAVPPSIADSDEARRELRSHLEAMIEDAMLAGRPPDRAVDDALVAIGQPAAIARAFRQAYAAEALTPLAAGFGRGEATLPRSPSSGRTLLWVALAAFVVQAQALLLLYLHP